MTLTIELTSEEESRLLRVAQLLRKPPAEVMRDLLAKLPEGDKRQARTESPRPSRKQAPRTLKGYGKYADLPTSSEEFARRKQEEIDHEEERALRRECGA